MSALGPEGEMLPRNPPEFGQSYSEYAAKSAQGPYVVHGGQLSDSGGDNFAPVRKQSPGTKENLHRFAGLGVGLAGVCAEHVLSHPCIVVRRQCQVHHDSQWFHLTPFSLVQVIYNMQRHQTMTTLWKGIGSTFMVKGIGVATEAAIAEFTPLPKEVNRHSSLKVHAQHLLLKGIGLIVVTPFFAASLVETVQSEIASERPGVLDCLREGASRLLGWSTQQSTRLLPVWKLVPPMVVHGLLHYVISSLAKYTVQVSMRHDMMEAKEYLKEDTAERTIYETYYPELIATFTGNLLADTLMYPLETVLHRICLQGTRTIIDNTDNGLGVIPIITRYEGVLDCFYSVLSQEGILGLYKGFGALVLQYGLHMAIVKLTKMIFERLSRQAGPQPGMAYTPRPVAHSSAVAAGRLSQHAPQHLQHMYQVGFPGQRSPQAHGSDVDPRSHPPHSAPRYRPDVPHRAPHLFQ